jgi:hypothetical protein
MMAKKASKSRRTGSVTSLKTPIARSLGEARSLRRRVADPEALDELIARLESLQKTAAIGCGRTFSRTFELTAAPKAAKRPRKK